MPEPDVARPGLGMAVIASRAGRALLNWNDHDPIIDWLYVAMCLFLTLMAGLMSGMTLGLLSLDKVELEVLLRSGTLKEQRYARKIIPLISNGHRLLVTLLLYNAIAMTALPLFLDELTDPVTAVVVSVTAVLFFGEIIPQSVCTRYGLRIGYHLAPLMRLLMFLSLPIAWPIGKILDLMLGHGHHTLFRRRQLKELVTIHAEDEGMGGALTRDEIKVITGALDLTAKVAARAMTPLTKLFMLHTGQHLDERTLRAILASGHSRIPIHAQGDRRNVVGLVLVKELLQYRLGSSGDVPVSMLRMRSIPRLPATTPMYDMLRLFQTGRSHMAVLTAPPPGDLRAALASDPSNTHGRPSTSGRGAAKKKSQLVLDPSAPHSGGTNAHSAGGSGLESGAGDKGVSLQDGSLVLDPSAPGSTGGNGDRRASGEGSAGGGGKDGEREGGGEGQGGGADGRGGALLRAARISDDGGSVGGGGSLYGDGYAESALYADSVADGDVYGTGGFAGSLLSPGDAAVAAFLDSPDGRASPSRGPTDLSLSPGEERGEPEQAEREEDGGAPGGCVVNLGPGSEAEPGMGTGEARGGSRGVFTSLGGAAAAAAAAADGVSADEGQHAVAAAGEAGKGASESASRAQQQQHHQHKKSRMAPKGEAADGQRASGEAEHAGHGQGQAHGRGAGDRRLQHAHSGLCEMGEEWLEEDVEEGTPIGIITIEDVIEELIRAEIVDETDRYVDNDRRIRVDKTVLARSLPEHLAKVLAAHQQGKLGGGGAGVGLGGRRGAQGQAGGARGRPGNAGGRGLTRSWSLAGALGQLAGVGGGAQQGVAGARAQGLAESRDASGQSNHGRGGGAAAEGLRTPLLQGDG